MLANEKFYRRRNDTLLEQNERGTRLSIRDKGFASDSQKGICAEMPEVPGKFDGTLMRSVPITERLLQVLRMPNRQICSDEEELPRQDDDDKSDNAL